MQILRNRSSGEIFISQGDYVKKVLTKFVMASAKLVLILLAQHFKLSAKQSPSAENEVLDMQKLLYANVVESIIYSVCTRLDLAHAASGTAEISKYMANPSRAHLEATKWVLRYLNGTAE